MHNLIEGMNALPVGGRSTTVYRQAPVKFSIAPRNEIAMPVRYIPFIVCKNSIVGIVGSQVHYLLKSIEAICFCAKPGLHERIERPVVLPKTKPLPVARSHHWTVLRSIGLKSLLL